jgi:hypothetical protein
MTGSRSSHKKPSIESRPLYAGHRLHSIHNSPVNLSQEIETPLVLMSYMVYDASAWVRFNSSLYTTPAELMFALLLQRL